MTFRLAVLLVASLAVAAAADAACLRCVQSGVQENMGTCEQSWDGYCSYPCCFMTEGERCEIFHWTYECATGGGALLVPSSYFATSLPLVTEGSALRLRLVKAQPVRRGQCGATLLSRRAAQV
jgi:hypothetical protein